MKKYVPTALAAVLLAGISLPMVAQAAQAAPTPAPEINAAKYDDAYFSRGELLNLTIGNSFAPSFSTTNYGDSVRIVDEKGDTRCTTTALWCDFTSALTVGEHTIKVVVDRDGTEVESSPLDVNVVDDGDTTTPVPDPNQPALPNPGVTDPGFGIGTPVPDPHEPAVPKPGVTDPGFGVETPAPGLEAPAVKLGENVLGMQQILVSLPYIGNGPDGKIRVFNESGIQVIDRSFGVGGTDLSLYVPGEHGQKHVYSVEIDTTKGVTPRSEIVVDRTNIDIPTPTLPFEPNIRGDRLHATVRGIPNSVATLSNSAGGDDVNLDLGAVGEAGITGILIPGKLNVFSIVVAKDGQTSGALTYTVDLRPTNPVDPAPVDPTVPNPGTTDPGFTIDPAPVDPAPVDPAVPNPGTTDPGFTVDPGPVTPAPISAPRVVAGHINPARHTAILTIVTDTVEHGAMYVVTDVKTGKKTELRIVSTERDYTVDVDDLGARDFTVVKKVGDRESAATTFHVDAAE